MQPADTRDILLSTVTMDLSRTVSEINGNFGQKTQIFLTAVLNACVEGLPLNIVTMTGLQKLECCPAR